MAGADADGASLVLLDPEALAPLLRELDGVERDVRRIRALLRAGEECMGLLDTICGIRDRIERFAGILLDAHLEDCFRGGVRSPGGGRRIRQLAARLPHALRRL